MTKATPKASTAKTKDVTVNAPAATAATIVPRMLDGNTLLVVPDPAEKPPTGEKTNAALEAAADQLSARGVRPNDVVKILAPIWEAVQDEFGV